MGDVFASGSSAPRVLSVRPSMSPALLEALRDAKALLDDGIFTQQEFEQEKERIILARSREFAMEQQNWPRGDAAARRGARAGAGAISPTPLKGSDSEVGEFSMDDLPECLYSTRDRGGLFKMKAKDAVQVLEDLREMQKIINAFKSSSSPEAYLEWASTKGFKDITLSSPGSYVSMKTFLIDRLNLWLEEVTPQLRGDPVHLRMTRAEVNGEIENVYYTGAKLRAHFNRLPKDLQRRMSEGEIKSFEQIYDYMAACECD